MKIYQFVVPAPIFIGINSSRNLCLFNWIPVFTGMTEWELKPDTNHGHGHVYIHGDPRMAFRSLSSPIFDDSLDQRWG